MARIGGGQVVGDRQRHVALGAQLVGRRHRRHRVLVIEAVDSRAGTTPRG
jgi:hypothetical protein